MTELPIKAAVDRHDGKLRLSIDPASVADWAHILAHFDGQTVEITVKAYEERLTRPQQKYWWRVVLPAITRAHEGVEADAAVSRDELENVHYGLVAEAFGTHEDRRFGRIPNKRSSKLTEREYRHLIDFAVRYAAQNLGCVVPLSNKVKEHW